MFEEVDNEKRTQAETGAPARERIVGIVRERLFVIRGEKVMLDSDLAELYGVTTSALNQAVARNRKRFPEDFAFRLTADEARALKSQVVISKGRGGRRRSFPRAFTEQGVAMLSSVLRSDRAVQTSIDIVRAFVALRAYVANVELIALRLENLESRTDRTDAALSVLFDELEKLQIRDVPPSRQIGFESEER